MKILLVNKFHFLKGGSEKYYFDLAKLLFGQSGEINSELTPYMSLMLE